DEVSVFRIFNVSATRQLIAALAVLAAALSIALSGDRSISAAGPADAARREDQIDIRKAILDTLRMVFHASCVQQHRCLCGSPDLGCTDDVCGGNAGDAFSDTRGVLPDEFTHFGKTECVVVDEPFINPAALDHHVEDSIGECAVAARPDRK